MSLLPEPFEALPFRNRNTKVVHRMQSSRGQSREIRETQILAE